MFLVLPMLCCCLMNKAEMCSDFMEFTLSWISTHSTAELVANLSPAEHKDTKFSTEHDARPQHRLLISSIRQAGKLRLRAMSNREGKLTHSLLCG